MEIDLAALDVEPAETAETLRSEVCIIGGGIAGLSLAKQLDGRCSVTLLEAGGTHRSGLTDSDPFHAELVGMRHRGTAEGRVRALGGCSLTWGGQLLALPADAAWPVSVAELRDYEAAWPVPADPRQLLPAKGWKPPKILAGMPELTPRLAAFLPFRRRNLARAWRRELRASDHVKVVLGAPATELLLAESGDRVAGVLIASGAGRVVRVEADQYVVAAGTVETCRLLLASRNAAPEGIGNTAGQVGRNFHDHLTLAVAEFTGPARERMLAELRPWILPAAGRGRALYSLKLEPSAALREALGLHRGMAHLTIEEPEESGVGRLRLLLKSRQAGRSAGSALSTAFRTIPGLLVHGTRLAWDAIVRRRRYVSPRAAVRLQLNLAQDAPSTSCVSLASEADARGVPFARVDWRVSKAELRSFRRFAAFLRAKLEAAGIREGVAWEPALLSDSPATDAALLARLDDARHAMGGACMGTDPRTSVVDPELRVHGIANLWIASPAVFPDGAAQLPTWTLGALCGRLAERLRRELRR